MKLLMLVNNNEDVELEKIKMCDDEYSDMFCSIKEILEHHPETWEQYAGNEEECDLIANMEIKELIDAKAEHSFNELCEEYLHCACAFLYGYQMAKKECEEETEEY